MRKFIILLLLTVSACFGQSKDPNIIIKNLKDNFKKVNDYTADVDIKVNVSFLKVPEMKAKIYFKQPDKMHIESAGFAMLPKGGLYTSPQSLLDGDFTAIYVKEEFFEGRNTSVIKIIPMNDKGDFILSTLWIDQSSNQLKKVESTTKTNGTFVIVFKYGSSKWSLPESIEFTFDTGRMKVSRNPMEDEQNSKAGKKDQANSTGKVTITYSNYVVNKGISDSVFLKKSKTVKD